MTMFKLKNIALVQIVIIILLLIIIVKLSFFSSQFPPKSDVPDGPNQGFLSPRVYTGLVKPHNFTVMNFVPLKTALMEFMTKNQLNMSVYVENLKSGASLGINEKDEYLPASLTKVLVAILVLRQVERGKITLDTLIDINPSDRLDTAGSLFMSSEQRLSLRTLLTAMLNESDNTALRILKRYTDHEDNTMIVKYLGYYTTGDIDKKDIGDNAEADLITPKVMYNLFSSLYLSALLTPEHSEFFLSSMVDTIFDIEEKAELPDEVTVAHKFGARYVEGIQCFHDCGIMYVQSKDMRIFYCIMTKDLDEQIAMDITGKIVNTIYSYSVNTRKRFDQYNQEWHASLEKPLKGEPQLK